MAVIKQITDVIESVEGIKLLDVDPGAATNRTVVTFVGEPEPVCNAAFLAVKKASELIDMSKHHGAHPRFGATDVCPLIPVSNITMEQTVEYARKLAKRIGEELSIPVYCYESAAFEPKRRNLANCRSGEYEALPKRIGSDEWHPDFGPREWNDGWGPPSRSRFRRREALQFCEEPLNTRSFTSFQKIQTVLYNGAPLFDAMIFRRPKQQKIGRETDHMGVFSHFAASLRQKIRFSYSFRTVDAAGVRVKIKLSQRTACYPSKNSL